jgi:hypothetical protein
MAVTSVCRFRGFVRYSLNPAFIAFSLSPAFSNPSLSRFFNRAENTQKISSPDFINIFF